MGLFNKKPTGGGILDVIRCDEPSYLVWKWHPQGTKEGETHKENAIRWGSSLRVKEGSAAVFVYKQKDGSVQDYIEGPFDGILKTKNLPIISDILGLTYEGGTPFQAEIYFINLAQIIQIKFAVPYFDVFDPRFLDYGVPTAVRGTISFRITDYKEFVKLHRLETFTLDNFQNQIKDAVTRYVKSTVANAPEENGIPVIQLERKLDRINEIVESKIKGRLFDEFGVTVSSVDVAVIDIDKTSEGYQQLMTVTRELTTQTMQAKTEVEIKEMRDTQKLGVLERAGRTVTNIKEDAYARHKETQSANLAAYQTEAQERVGVAGAIGLGKMGANGGGSAGGFNPVGIIAGMAIGGAVGQNIAGAMNRVMGGQNKTEIQEKAASSTQARSSVPGKSYNVAVDGKATGPFDIQTLGQMVMAGQLTKDSPVWTAGMSQWLRAGEVEYLKSLFEMPPVPAEDNEMPPIPSDS